VKSASRKLFELIEKIGEHLEDGLHIIDSSDEYPATDGDGKYRIYHADGFCFDIKKEFVGKEESMEGVDDDGCTYVFDSGWDGFKDISVTEAIDLIKNSVDSRMLKMKKPFSKKLISA
jgi:hypothetical protein